VAAGSKKQPWTALTRAVRTGSDGEVVETPPGSKNMASYAQEVVHTWEICQAPKGKAVTSRKAARSSDGLTEVGGLIVALKRVMTVERRSLYSQIASGTQMEAQEVTNRC